MSEVNTLNEPEIASHLLYLAPLNKLISDLKSTDSDDLWLTAVLHMIHLFSSKDPAPIHFVTSRDYLKEKGVIDDRAVDMLARELVTACQNMQTHINERLLSLSEGETPLFVSREDGVLALTKDCPGFFFYEKNESNLIDLLFSEFIHSIGKTGALAASAIESSAKERYSAYKASEHHPDARPSSWSLWIKSGLESVAFSPYLAILTDIIWQDLCFSVWDRKTKNVPAFTHGVHPTVTKILSPRAEARRIENQLHMMHDGKIIATLPTIDPKLIPAVTKGAGNLNSIYHHKLLRFECKSGFENWIHNKPDARVLRFERGCTEIADCLGIRSNRAIEEIKALLIAQAYMHFNFDDGSSGNLIVLRNFRSKGCNRDDGIEIVLGTQLLPHYTFQTTKRERLLIPVPQLPPLVSSANYHAGQALLQMMVMQEFTENSIEFFETDSISIPDETWREFFKEVKLPSTVFKQTIDRWLHDGDDGPCFLTKIEKDRYALGISYRKETDFLKYQGSLRKQRQKEGEKSVVARKKQKSS